MVPGVGVEPTTYGFSDHRSDRIWATQADIGAKYWSRTSLKRVAAAYIAVLTTLRMYGGKPESWTLSNSATNCRAKPLH